MCGRNKVCTSTQPIHGLHTGLWLTDKVRRRKAYVIIAFIHSCIVVIIIIIFINTHLVAETVGVSVATLTVVAVVAPRTV